MIKMKQVIAVRGETTLIFEVDFPDGSVRDVMIPLSDIYDRAKELKQIVNREITLADVRDIVRGIVEQMRRGRMPLIERIDFSQYIGVDLEA